MKSSSPPGRSGPEGLIQKQTLWHPHPGIPVNSGESVSRTQQVGTLEAKSTCQLSLLQATPHDVGCEHGNYYGICTKYMRRCGQKFDNG